MQAGARHAGAHRPDCVGRF